MGGQESGRSRIDLAHHDGGVALSGRLDARTAAEARDLLHAAVGRGEGDLVVTIADLEIWGADGLGVLVGAHSWARRHDRRLTLVDVPPRQLRLLRSAGLDRILGARPLAVA